jgi:hypothetical protein
MDAGWVLTGLIATPAAKCGLEEGPHGDDGCLPQTLGAVVVSTPVLILFGMAALTEMNEDSAARGSAIGPPSDAGTLQLAREVEAQVSARQCIAARATMDRIAARDAEYHIAMLANGALGTCATDGPGARER